MKIVLLFLLFLLSLCSTAQVRIEEFDLKLGNGNLTGELSIPYAKKSTLIVFIAGSGPTDRNGNSKATKSDCYRILSDSLLNYSFATLRLDKRSVGKSLFPNFSEADMSIDTLVRDVEIVVDSLIRSRRFSDIYILGHSEGSLIGILVCQRVKNIKGFISVSGAGIPADSIIMKQISSQPEVVKNIISAYLDTLRQGILLTNVPQSLYALFRPSVQPYMISWIKYNPSIEISRLNIPSLILQGSSDLQVSISDGELLNKSCSNSEFIVLNKTNHVLKLVESIEDNKKSYSDASFPLNIEIVKSINAFITK